MFQENAALEEVPRRSLAMQADAVLLAIQRAAWGFRDCTVAVQSVETVAGTR